MAMLTACCWVPTGAMKRVPLRLSEKPEMGDDPNDDTDDDANWEDVPEEEEEEDQQQQFDDGEGDNLGGAGGGKSNSNKKKSKSYAAEVRDAKKNPGAVFDQGQNVLDQIGSDDEDEAEDTVIKPTDMVLVTARANEETPSLELYIYDDPTDHLYLHHDMPLSAFPLSTCWLSDGSASLCLVGTMHPFVEVWNLDTIDAVEPIGVLGGCKDPLDNYKRKVRKSKLKESSHTDGVISLDWNTNQQNMVLSGSADGTCKLWDLTTTDVLHTAPHDEKVQCVKWHPTEASQLLTGTFGGTVTLFDARNSDYAQTIQLESCVEKAQFCYNSDRVYVSLSSGHFGAYDRRKLDGGPLFVVQSNPENTTFAINRHKPALAATGGKDGVISLWDVSQLSSSGAGDGNSSSSTTTAGGENNNNNSSLPKPEGLSQKKLGVGEVFSMDFHPNHAYMLTAVGATGRPLVYHTQEDTAGRFEK